jgi:hypothetical protein
MTTKAWSHLPNAKHIDWVLETLEKDPKVWRASLFSVEHGALDVFRSMWGAAGLAVWSTSWDSLAVKAALDAAGKATNGDAKGAMWGAIAALVAWDDSGSLLDMSVEEVTELARAGNQAAVLMLPAVIVKNKLKEKNT